MRDNNSNYERSESAALRGIVIAQQREIEELKEALKGARKFGWRFGYGIRKFSEACGVSATRMSQWTAELSEEEPDIACRRL